MSASSIPTSEILNACEGMLRKQLYVVFTRPTAGLGPVMAVIKEHLDFQIDLERRFAGGSQGDRGFRSDVQERRPQLRSAALAAH